jgi:integrase
MDGSKPTAIFARISYGADKALKYYTDETILPKYWNSATKPHRVKETSKFPEYPEFNNRLNAIEAAIKNTIRTYKIDNGEVPSRDVLKGLLDRVFSKVKDPEKMTFFRFFQQFIDDSKNGLREAPIASSTIATYQSTKNLLHTYCTARKRDIDFHNMDVYFYADLKKYMTLELKFSTNHIAKQAKIIKTVMREAVERRYTTNTDFTSKVFSAATESTTSVALSEEELAEMANLDLHDTPKLERVRDLFLVGCYTGLRFSDLATLRPEHIRDNTIRIDQQKTGEPVVIPVHSKVSAILSKYGGELPRALSNQKTNEYLKQVAGKCDMLKKLVKVVYTKAGVREVEQVLKCDLIRTHTARRSFATNLHRKGVPSLSIMAVTGHKTETVFLKYIKQSTEEHAEVVRAKQETDDNRDNNGENDNPTQRAERTATA